MRSRSWIELVIAGGARQSALNCVRDAEWRITAPRNVRNKTSGDINPTAMQQRWKSSVWDAVEQMKACLDALLVLDHGIAIEIARERTGKATRNNAMKL